MANGKLRKVAVIGAAIGGVIFFWRKRKAKSEPDAVGVDTAVEPDTTEAAGATTE